MADDCSISDLKTAFSLCALSKNAVLWKWHLSMQTHTSLWLPCHSHIVYWFKKKGVAMCCATGIELNYY